MSGSVETLLRWGGKLRTLRSSGYHLLNFIAIHLQLNEIFKITRVSFFWHTVYKCTSITKWKSRSPRQKNTNHWIHTLTVLTASPTLPSTDLNTLELLQHITQWLYISDTDHLWSNKPVRPYLSFSALKASHRPYLPWAPRVWGTTIKALYKSTSFTFFYLCNCQMFDNRWPDLSQRPNQRRPCLFIRCLLFIALLSHWRFQTNISQSRTFAHSLHCFLACSWRSPL